MNPTASGSIDVDEKIVALTHDKRVSVPPYPAVALRLHEVTNRASFAITDVVEVVSADQALTATVLRAANSAMFGAMGAATTLQQAVSRLGASEVARVALAAGLAESVKSPGALQSLRRQTWAEGVACAAVSHALARLRGLSQRDAFTCGLLQDFGKIVGIAALEQVLRENPGIAARPELEWRASLARVVPELSALVATTWSLPPLLQQAMTLRTPAAFAKSPNAALLEVVWTSGQVIGLMMRMSHVGAAELGQLKSLRPAELEPLAAMLPGIPAMITAFEPEQQQKAVPSKSIPPVTALGSEPLRALTGVVSQLRPAKRGPFQLTGINGAGWSMTGPVGLPERQMFEASLALPSPAGAPLKMWASTARSVAEGSGFRVECMPFALDRDGKKRWAELVASAKG